MDPHKTALTAANIKYLLVLYKLGKGNEGIRCVDVAARLGVRKPSVYTMIATLSSLGLATKEKYGTVHLTDAGNEIASRYETGFHILYGRLEGVLGLPDENCRNTVFALLAQASDEGLAELCRSNKGESS